jgi:hypothetical protein
MTATNVCGQRSGPNGEVISMSGIGGSHNTGISSSPTQKHVYSYEEFYIQSTVHRDIFL